MVIIQLSLLFDESPPHGQLAQVVLLDPFCQSSCTGWRMALENDPMKNQRVPVMMSTEEVEAIDEWRRKHPDLPSRSEAIRQLLAAGLKAAKGK
jgi:hypothetical protein